MKLQSSSSCSNSTSSVASFDANMCSSKSATAGCLSAILRRLLCSGSGTLPTYPSDHIPESYSTHHGIIHCEISKPSEKIEASATPNLVARLMGLESIPDTKKSPNSISRSRSMNSLDSKEQFDQLKGQHRRVKTTMSFREMPVFVEQESDDFFVLSFENGVENKELNSKKKRHETGFGELKQRRTEKCKMKENKTEKLAENQKKSRKENHETRKVVNEKCARSISDKATHKLVNSSRVKDSKNTSLPLKTSSGRTCLAHELKQRKTSFEEACVTHEARQRSKPKNLNKMPQEPKLRKKKLAHDCVVKNIQAECSSEESSPVSVLDFSQHIMDREAHTSEEGSSSEESNSRRKLSPELECYELFSPCNNNNLIEENGRVKKIQEKCFRLKRRGFESDNYIDVLDEIVKSNWIHGDVFKLREIEDIGAAFVSQILEQLLDELVVQLNC